MFEWPKKGHEVFPANQDLANLLGRIVRFFMFWVCLDSEFPDFQNSRFADPHIDGQGKELPDGRGLSWDLRVRPAVSGNREMGKYVSRGIWNIGHLEFKRSKENKVIRMKICLAPKQCW